MFIVNELSRGEDFRDKFLKEPNQKRILTYLLNHVIDEIIEPTDVCPDCTRPLKKLLQIFVSSLTKTYGKKGLGNAFNIGHSINQEQDRILKQVKAAKRKSTRDEAAKASTKKAKEAAPHHSKKSKIFSGSK